MPHALMPPKKKAQLPSQAPSAIPQDDQPMADATPVAEAPVATPVAPVLQADPWTDEQEISLFKGVVNWKPAGMHKHFRMIAIAQQLRHHGVTGPDDRHTRIPGIWRKLRTLYNLEAIDARENSIGAEEDEGEERGAAQKEFLPFSLPEEEFGDLMFARRLANDGSTSPQTAINPQIDAIKRGPDRGISGNARGSTAGIDDTEEDTEMKSTPQPRQRKAVARGGRIQKSTPRQQIKPGPKRRGPKAAAEAAEEEEGTGEEADEEEGEDGNNEEEEARDDSPVAGSPTIPNKKGVTKAVKGAGRPKKGQGGTDIRRSSRRK